MTKDEMTEILNSAIDTKDDNTRRVLKFVLTGVNSFLISGVVHLLKREYKKAEDDIKKSFDFEICHEWGDESMLLAQVAYSISRKRQNKKCNLQKIFDKLQKDLVLVNLPSGHIKSVCKGGENERYYNML